ncbi:STAS domain-containing protein [Streptomyces sp. NPDC059851]|uniref:STAS domain-containing protein n=1 Tax=Streptomyces sp. NPDC059851 TaxID=3346971 RepID=UPI003657C6BE
MASTAAGSRERAHGDGSGEQFAVEVRRMDSAVVLLLFGELDHDTAEPLRAALDAALAAGGPVRLIIDCAGLAFCDSTGLNMLLRARLAAEEAGGSVELASLGRQVARMLRLTGADGVFTIHRDLSEAVSSGGSDDGGSSGTPAGPPPRKP